jgi:hypothetical protein
MPSYAKETKEGNSRARIANHSIGNSCFWLVDFYFLCMGYTPHLLACTDCTRNKDVRSFAHITHPGWLKVYLG